ncbi:hypothetical protein CXG81DRAFT_29790 [Caulochytrium protostelioides]|uniref:UDP-galactose transporter homolog 1 n=1 Tax=Caulochytrium protostelioides TaxID=1555241 RepID=A0A4P9X7S3_9FUNG|nr:hypothetical protein CXG81DRAFT_29790 [Caulochytrium protostelioides]|eukprot:RKP01304.1 hypothetical protein CXG81DRAFT_29790 [Caulochytrium protostelioides]
MGPAPAAAAAARPSWVALIFCVLGIYTCFLTWGVTQERVTTTKYGDGKFRYFLVLNVVQALMAAVVARLYLLFQGKRLDVITTELRVSFVKLAFLSTISSHFSYASLKHIDYPTLILGKSCKLVPVMFMKSVLHRLRFHWTKYAVVTLITAGVSAFMILHEPEATAGPSSSSAKKHAAANSLWGVGLLMAHLLIDGLTNSTQDQVFRTTKVSGTTMMYYMNLFSAAMILAWITANPYSMELWDAIAFCKMHPAVIRDILIFGATGALGQCFIFYTVAHFGSMTLVTVTVTRKMFSILISVTMFGHHLSLGQWAAVGVVFTGIGLEALDDFIAVLVREQTDRALKTVLYR